MSHVAAWGFPVPRQGHIDSARSGDLVLERLNGPTMADALLTGGLDVRTGAELLAGLLGRLHSIPARGSNAPDHRILHLDLHPENVIITTRGPVVIDWTNATEGPPGLDRAMSALILAQVALTIPPPQDVAVRALLDAFREEISSLGGISDRDLSKAVDRRGADPNQTPAERDLLAAAAVMITAGSD